MKQIFMAHTPYHLLLSCGLATLNNSSDGKYLIIIPSFSEVDVFRRSLTEWDNNIFSKIVIINDISDATGKAQPFRAFRDNIKEVKAFFLSNVNESSEVFIFNDTRPEAQLLARLNHDYGGSNIYVEDGSAAYGSFVVPRMPIRRKLIFKVAFGMWFENNRIFGAYKHIDKIMVNRPDLIRSELSSKDPIKIPKKIFNNIRNFMHILLRNYSVNNADFAPKYILVISHSEDVSSASSDIYKYLVKYLHSCSSRVYVKYHPGEHNDDFLGLKVHFPRVKFIPKTLPLEAIFIALQGEDKPKLIIGDLSTSLLTANYLLDDTCVISIMKLTDLIDPNIENIFKNIGVLVPEDIEDLKSIIKLNNIN